MPYVTCSVSRPEADTGEHDGNSPSRSRQGRSRALATESELHAALELPRGGDLQSTSRKYGVTVGTRTEWRHAFMAAGAEELKIRQEDLVDEQGRRQKRVFAELAMENELLRERIRRMEDFKLFCGGGSRE